jgi:2-oxoglutarate ferredoxin oxidoreductase subunit beta
MDTNAIPSLQAKDYKSDVKPIWCPGCGHFAVLAALTKALAFLGLPKEDVVLVSGIGCSSRLPAYIDGYGFHGLHGRGLPLASGLKAARPELTVIVAGGDGDGFSIGGNHFLHACRRNMDLTYIVMDNEVYGMTKGQASPTTQPDWCQSKLTPHGTGIRRFQPAAIALAAGASFIARGFAGDPAGLTRLLAAAIEHPGFAFVHVLSPCRTFRPEQQAWKARVHPCGLEPARDIARAAELIQRDDGMALGILFEQQIPVYAAGVVATNDEHRRHTAAHAGALAQIEAELCR